MLVPRDFYVREQVRKLREADLELDRLVEAARRAEGERKRKLDEETRALREKRSAAWMNVDILRGTLKNAWGERDDYVWDRVQGRVEETMADFLTAMDEAAARHPEMRPDAAA